jgi:endonuclease YncB( thermonuclease family)
MLSQDIFSFLTCSLTFLLLLSGQVSATSFSGQVVRVLDGDTIEVLHAEKAERIRLSEIDSPEKGQPFGQAAKTFVLKIAAGKIVTLNANTIDRYARIVGEVILPGGLNLNAHLVANGYAWHYKYYSDDTALAQLETNDRARKVGLWVEPNPVPPWEWRRGKRGLPKEGNNLCTEKRSCHEMNNCQEAKFFFEICGLLNLDIDSDGVPCEKLCQ